MRVCLHLPAYSASAKVIFFAGKLEATGPAYFNRAGSLFQTNPRWHAAHLVRLAKQQNCGRVKPGEDYIFVSFLNNRNLIASRLVRF